MRFYLASESDTLALADQISTLLQPGDTVLLKGDLGTGKSVFVRRAARGLGVKGPMPSPTFTLMQCYKGKMPLCHFDLYRLEDAEEFFEAGLDEPLGRDLCFIEWPMDEVDIPAPWIQLELAHMNGPTERSLEVQWNGLTEQRARKLREMLRAWEM
ncbi:MAG: tRNA (adenosine(37)-N6)-threonylcarbamoyltransferase complex ATPase subunit type 1 TsaE [Clostridiales bacterium]|jgi:tRNA threonylcarbamoyl adenosine modification protein YjeE|nr:tRNA (adenosine(37)-N6)-threonylcarbamoyltransferase complex ATPase subunit type 1 TsaE [Bacillota bacterium]NLL54239.1 tRNA (adenosine(37)-N6)-threonylcarbamoyltransferase complex ATPase subunit type 1 TsaE [Clostridiales bacterium]